MAFGFTQNDFDLFSKICGKEITNSDETNELKEIYQKLENLVKSFGDYKVQITKRVDSFRTGKCKDYFWSKVYPNNLFESCKDKAYYVFGISKGNENSSSLYYHLGYDDDFKSETCSTFFDSTYQKVPVLDMNDTEIKDYCEKLMRTHYKYLLKMGSDLKIETCIKILNEMTLQENVNLLKSKKNIILQGAPGTGKTYSTREIAESLCDGKYEDLVKSGRVAFTTFHQSMDYENFVEGLKPEVKEGGVVYNIEPGIFKTIADRARGGKIIVGKRMNGEIVEEAKEGYDKKPYLLIIDEINRGNISKILGELITLLEASKREGEAEELKAVLPYSKEEFGVPSNLYILGTMNTTDRSAGQIDYAIRRRFAFVTLKADRSVIEYNISDGAVKDKALSLFDKVSEFIKANKSSDEDFDDLMVGHSYFIAKTEPDLDMKMKYEVQPLIREYKKDGLLNDAEIPAELKCYE